MNDSAKLSLTIRRALDAAVDARMIDSQVEVLLVTLVLQIQDIEAPDERAIAIRMVARAMRDLADGTIPGILAPETLQ